MRSAFSPFHFSYFFTFSPFSLNPIFVLREISATSFELLLERLDADDRESAGAKYIELRENLTKFFTWRGFSEADEHADESLNRAARRLGEGEAVEDLRKYIFGIARLLCFDINRAEQRKRLAFAELPRQISADENEIRRREMQHRCLDKCLREAGDDERFFMLNYYQGTTGGKIENRKQMLAESNLSPSGFRMKALRLREKIEKCVKNCCEKQAEK